MEDQDALSGLPPEERARIAALLAERGDDGDDAWVEEPVGPIRRVVRLLLRSLCLAAAGVIGWHYYALASLPDKPFNAVFVPIGLTIASGLAGIVLLLWFDGKWRRILLLLLGGGALAFAGNSMRWVESSHSGVHEYWAGLPRSAVKLSGDLCYRIDAETFALGGGRAVFTYRRGIWPSNFGEAEFRRYFFSDLRMAARADGWKCIARGA